MSVKKVKQTKSSLPKWATTVTPFSKALAMAIFVVVPILAFYFGRYYEHVMVLGY
ncbi:MAG: hypothetical protein WC775_02095 [Patescibacteria group bacterium]|jgi:hypothetical protein